MVNVGQKSNCTRSNYTRTFLTTRVWWFWESLSLFLKPLCSHPEAYLIYTFPSSHPNHLQGGQLLTYAPIAGTRAHDRFQHFAENALRVQLLALVASWSAVASDGGERHGPSRLRRLVMEGDGRG